VEFARALRTRLGDPSPGSWQKAVDRLVFPWARSVAMLFEVEALLELDRREDATKRLEQAYDLASDSGVEFARRLAVDLARRARLDLDAPELAPTPDELGLTPREREVLGLVAEGRTNREIGERLFITEKTASVHVSNILSKLGVDNRVEAAATAHRLGLIPGH
ncbi:MAG: response regulator transcription factor, partial [Nitriliruptorales bacterium]|nr:response regulator transcription factor [Nitriliruptorales bacterium]